MLNNKRSAAIGKTVIASAQCTPIIIKYCFLNSYTTLFFFSKKSNEKIIMQIT
jgi:hypothetical protein